MKKTFSIRNTSVLLFILIFTTLIFTSCTPNAKETPSTEQQEDSKVCTEEAMACPDGSYVSRIPPDCEFEACPTTEQQNEQETNSETSQTSQQTKEFDIEAKKFEFIPNTITVNQGDKVILHITSTDTKHGIGIPAFDIMQDLNEGETTDIEFIADKTGTFSFICNVFCGTSHSDMKGTLIVE